MSVPIQEKFLSFVYFQHGKINESLKLARTRCRQEPVAEQDNWSVNAMFTSQLQYHTETPALKFSSFPGDWYIYYKTKGFCVTYTFILDMRTDRKHTNFLIYEIMYADMIILNQHSHLQESIHTFWPASEWMWIKVQQCESIFRMFSILDRKYRRILCSEFRRTAFYRNEYLMHIYVLKRVFSFGTCIIQDNSFKIPTVLKYYM